MKPLLPEKRNRELDRINRVNSIQKFGVRKKSGQILFRKFGSLSIRGLSFVMIEVRYNHGVYLPAHDFWLDP